MLVRDKDMEYIRRVQPRDVLITNKLVNSYSEIMKVNSEKL